MLLGCFACGTQISLESYIPENPEPYNKAIMEGIKNGEVWVQTPENIVYKLFLYDDPEVRSSIDIVKSSRTKQIIRATQEGLKDDSIEGEMCYIYFEKEGGQWEITGFKKGYKCKEGRGKSYYSGELCN